MLLLALAAATWPVRLRADLPPLDDARARAMSPATLGDTLLAAGHPPVVAATVGPEGMVVPPPPGTVAVRLVLRAEPAERPDFCRRTVVTVTIARPAATLETRTDYRWIGAAGRAQAPDAPDLEFLAPEPDECDTALDTVELLARLNRQARAGCAPSFPVSIDDQLGREMTAFARAHPRLPHDPDLGIITDPRAALAQLSPDQVTWAGPAHHALPDLLTPADKGQVARRRLDARIIHVHGEWTATLLLDGDRVVRMRLLHAVAPPF